MAITSIDTVNNIVNRVAIGVGLAKSPDPYASTDQNFIQMVDQLRDCGEDLSLAAEWEFLRGTHSFTTAASDSGTYDLPDDFLYPINQTSWDRANDKPVDGPLSDQQWAYLEGRGLSGSGTIYAHFRYRLGKMELHPSPPTAGLEIHFEYQSTKWIQDANTPTTHKADFASGGDKPLFNKTLLIKMLKYKFLESKGFDYTEAKRDFFGLFEMLSGLDSGSKILRVGGGRGANLLSMRNVPDTGYGT